MADNETENTKKTPANVLETLQAVSEKPFIRQLALMLGIAASVALGVAVILWSQSPDYSVLYNDIPESQMADVSNTLKQMGVDYKIDPLTGKVLVAAADVSRARIELASKGIHKIKPKGFDILDQEQGFGTSQFIQNARYKKALEDELSMSVATMAHIKNARVHLAIPKQSVFVRDKQKPTASVMVEMFSGYVLEKEQILAISNMVAASIEGMSYKDVTIVDQMGRMLTDHEQDDKGINDKQMKYTQKLEQNYIDKVSRILTPILGRNGFSVQVKADIDFDQKEMTSEQYNPDLTAIRSKQTLIERSSGNQIAGIPGALSNQPPGGSIAPEKTNTGANNKEGESTPKNKPFHTRESSTENYEVDKSISHVAYSIGKIRQLSVAVVVDNKKTVDSKGKVSSTPRTDKELQSIRTLVQETVGYNIQRGDTVQVVNTAFVPPEPLEALPETPVWEQPWFAGVVKQVLAGLVVLYLIFGVIRPAFKNLSRPVAGEMVSVDGEQIAIGADGKPIMGPDGKPLPASAVAADGTVAGAALGAPEQAVDADGNALPSPDEQYQMELELARKLVLDDPKVAAQVIKKWIST